jgi:hypothetical protein
VAPAPEWEWQDDERKKVRSYILPYYSASIQRNHRCISRGIVNSEEPMHFLKALAFGGTPYAIVISVVYHDRTG